MKTVKIVLTSLALSLAFLASAWASTVTLAWDPNPASENVAGYTIYQGPLTRSYDPATKLDVTDGTQGLLKLSDTAKTYLAVTAWTNTAGQRIESDYSNEVIFDPTLYSKPSPPGNARAVKIVVTRPDGTTLTLTVP